MPIAASPCWTGSPAAPEANASLASTPMTSFPFGTTSWNRSATMSRHWKVICRAAIGPRLPRWRPICLPATARSSFHTVGEERQLTQAYAQIAESLQEIGNAGVAHIPLEAVQDHSDGPPSIMNVTMLDQIGGDSAMIKIRGVKDGKLGEPVAIRRSHLAALTTELVFRWRIHPGKVPGDCGSAGFSGLPWPLRQGQAE